MRRICGLIRNWFALDRDNILPINETFKSAPSPGINQNASNKSVRARCLKSIICAVNNNII